MAQTGTVFWADGKVNGKIGRVLTDGSGFQVIHSGLTGAPVALDVDLANHHLYWVEPVDGRIRRSNFNGSNVVDLVTGLGYLSGLSLDLINGKMYWTTFSDLAVDGLVQRANLDGTNLETLVTGLVAGAWAIEVDPTGAGKMYWGMPAFEVRRANLDGSSVQTIHSNANDNINGVTLDIANGKVHFTSIGPSHLIQNTDLNGANLQALPVSAQLQPMGIDYEPTLDLLVWATKFGNNGTIALSQPDGSQYQVILTGMDVLDVAVIPFVIPEPATSGLVAVGILLLLMGLRSLNHH